VTSAVATEASPLGKRSFEPPWNHRHGLSSVPGRTRVKTYLPAAAATPAMISASMRCQRVLPNREPEPSRTAPPTWATVSAATMLR
jgi:hypothetical protein